MGRLMAENQNKQQNRFYFHPNCIISVSHYISIITMFFNFCQVFELN
jgi:hypothetical protein